MKEILDLKKDFEREERNMLYLRHPYLTLEQSHGHMKEIKEQRPHIMEKYNEYKVKKFSRQYTFAEALSHLRVKDAWD